MNVERAIAAALGAEPIGLSSLCGGCVGEVYRVEMPGGERLVAKVDRADAGQLHIEAFMLEFLAPHLPVPAVVHATPNLLVMEWVPGHRSFSADVETHAAELLANLHGVTSEHFGFSQDTLIGALPQPNPPSPEWLPFFAEHRLLYMARLAREAGRLDAFTVARVATLAGRLDRYLVEPARPSLLHGDVWSGNVLAEGGRITGFLDPAVYFGHPEVELAFITMFSTFGSTFFAEYEKQRGIEPGFMEERRHLYNLYPYLVHVRLFGDSYRDAVEGILSRFGI